MQNIRNTFINRQKWVNNRSSTIFPIYINQNNDQYLVFQNYWLWKNNIKKIFFLLTLRNHNSKIIKKKIYEVKNHNEISIKKFFNKKFFFGQIECEILSKENLRYPYPAILMFYKNRNGYQSSVHSAGRHLNDSEKVSSKFYESNFYCKLDKNFEPVIHVFCGKELGKKKKLHKN